jgi:glycerol-3-phosphate dehydrogenase (NAD(P)+)
MVFEGAGLVAAATDEQLATALAAAFNRAGVVCERSDDPIGVELSGAAKNAAALASGATVAQGLNAAGAAAGHIFAEVWRWAESLGARPESMIGLAGTGDLVGTALAPQSRNRRAGELLAQGVPAADIPSHIGQAIEALESVPLLAKALAAAGVNAPVNTALSRLIEGTLPLDEWIVVVRATVPPPARWRRAVKPGFWRRLRQRLFLRGLRSERRLEMRRPDTPASAEEGRAPETATAGADGLASAPLQGDVGPGTGSGTAGANQPVMTTAPDAVARAARMPLTPPGIAPHTNGAGAAMPVPPQESNGGASSSQRSPTAPETETAAE